MSMPGLTQICCRNQFARRLAGALALVLTLLASPASAQTHIAATGDSITSGYPESWCGRGRSGWGLPYGGYSPYLQYYLDNGGWNSTVYNYGIAGDRATWAAQETSVWCTNETWVHTGLPIRHNQINVAIARDPRPDYLLFMFGTNDLTWHSSSTVMAWIEYDLSIVIDAGITPIIGTLLPDFYPGHEVKDITGLNARIRAWAAENDIVVADHYNATSYSNWYNLLYYDGLHPLGGGRQLMAETWFDALEEQKAIEEAEAAAARRRLAAALAAATSLLLLE